IITLSPLATWALAISSILRWTAPPSGYETGNTEGPRWTIVTGASSQMIFEQSRPRLGPALSLRWPFVNVQNGGHFIAHIRPTPIFNKEFIGKRKAVCRRREPFRSRRLA